MMMLTTPQGHHLSFVPNADDDTKGTLQISGYLRGSRPLSANQLIHITGRGDYQLSHITTSVIDGFSVGMLSN
jgi:hypothetical protein